MGEQMLPLVLIHGYPLDHTMWFGVIAALGGGVRTIAPDLRGFGRSGMPAGEPSLDTMADDILRQLDRDNIPRAVFAGMSMGGYVALSIAERARERVAGLALVNSQPYADSAEARAGRQEMIQKVRATGVGAAANAIIPKMFSAKAAANPDFQRFAVAGAEAAGVDGICWALEAMARRPDRSSVLVKAEFPILILHSAEDKIVPLEKAREFAALNPKSFLVSVREAGHGAAMEAPDEVANALRRFLEICSKPGEQTPADVTETAKS